MSKENKITKEWLEEQYLILNKTQEDIALLVGCSRKNITYYLKKYNIQKSIEQIEESKKQRYFEKHGVYHQLQNPKVQEKIRKTNLEKYGVANPAQNEDIKNKIIETNLEKYGYKTPLLNKRIKKKTIRTNQERYGFDHHFQNSNIQQKIKKSLLKKYQVSHPMYSSEIKSKLKNMYLEKFGVPNPAQSDDIKLKIKKTNLQRYGVESTTQLPQVKERLKESLQEKYGVESIFKIEQHRYENKIKNIEQITSLNLKIAKWDKQLDDLKYRPDFKLSERTYLNVDGLYWHSELKKHKNYHFQMRKDYEDKSLRIFQFRADEVYHKFDIINSMILNHLNQNKEKIGARKTKIKVVSTNEAKLFLDKNHIKGYKACKHLGLYYNDNLISIMSYKVIKNILKIERFCSQTNTSVLGGFSKLLNAVLKEISKDVIIHYWVDLRYGTGTFLLKQGFKFEKETLGWEWTDGVKTFNRLRCRANMDERCLSEKEYAEELGWYRIYDAGQRLYIKEFRYEQK